MNKFIWAMIGVEWVGVDIMLLGLLTGLLDAPDTKAALFAVGWPLIVVGFTGAIGGLIVDMARNLLSSSD